MKSTFNIVIFMCFILNCAAFRRYSLTDRRSISLNSLMKKVCNSNNFNNIPTTTTAAYSNKQATLQTVRTVLAVAFTTLSLNPTLASAGENKDDKSFQLCLSKCLYANTKPPPVGSSTERLENTTPRNEVLRECKKGCATSKDQLLIGAPKKKQLDIKQDS